MKTLRTHWTTGETGEPEVIEEIYSDRKPPLNRALDDYLAFSQGEGEQALMLNAWLLAGAERLARIVGRSEARLMVDEVEEFIRTASPAKEWGV